MTASPGLTHEFWIEPADYQPQIGDPLVAHIRNGENFKGGSLAFFDSNIARFEIWQNGQSAPVEGRMGDIPVLETRAEDAGLVVLVHQTTPSRLTYRTWAKFQKFADHKDFPGIRARHDARGLPEADFVETYTRFAKSLIAIGDGSGTDVDTGLETEFVALANPYQADLSGGMPVRLLYRGAPRPDAQIEMFDKAPDGSVQVRLYRTDARGEAVLPVTPGHSYLLDAVVLRPVEGQAPVVWETLWAALTFAVPAR